MANIETRYFKNINDIRDFLKLSKPVFFHGSQTSMVVPYEKIEQFCLQENIDSFLMGDLNQMPPVCEVDDNGVLTIRGSITWKEGREFAQTKGRNILTSPTEELAALLSGIATSCTGERCFGFGTYRDHLIEVTYLDHQGELKTLRHENLLIDHELFQSEEARKLLTDYQKSYEFYSQFKNAPFPRLERETDLMTGTEGQLGVIIEAKIKTAPLENVTYIFLTLPKWEEDYSLHLRVFDKVQNLRDKIFSVELIDENSWSYLPQEMIPRPAKDIIFLEIADKHFDEIYESVLAHLPELSEDDIFQVNERKCKDLRMEIPRAVFESNSKMGVTKKGTDVQVTPERFQSLMDYYRKMTNVPFEYNLFGHFGDAHLHFNYMPKPEQVEAAQEMLEEMYKWVKEEKGSPFAEHGIGLLKKRFIWPFYEDVHFQMFAYLKKKMDPQNLFFPHGFMSMKKG
ncbi:MAG: FAD-binding oxidoreductase [Leptospiraceae bacterium]|nr:FAD-binding oxidoreductase [Leptospiraceae bacterium]